LLCATPDALSLLIYKPCPFRDVRRALSPFHGVRGNRNIHCAKIPDAIGFNAIFLMPRPLICEILKGHVGRCFPNAVGGVHALVKLSQAIGHHMIREIAVPHTPLNHGEKILCNLLPPPSSADSRSGVMPGNRKSWIRVSDQKIDHHVTRVTVHPLCFPNPSFSMGGLSFLLALLRLFNFPLFVGLDSTQYN
jgi:hypothetical protein